MEKEKIELTGKELENYKTYKEQVTIPTTQILRTVEEKNQKNLLKAIIWSYITGVIMGGLIIAAIIKSL